jgi:hypothetical protein
MVPYAFVPPMDPLSSCTAPVVQRFPMRNNQLATATKGLENLSSVLRDEN